jgi:nucleotide-binding universal stress UspA family protein
MGRHGMAGRLALLIGRMTSRVLDMGFPRVLVVPKDFIISGTRVLLATDDSPGALKAVEEAMSLGNRSSILQHLTVMSVAKRETDVPEIKKRIETLCLRLAQAGPQVFCEALVEVGDPAELIIRAARERETDMILIGGQGNRGIARKLLGHVTRNVTGKSHCAVLVVNT